MKVGIPQGLLNYKYFPFFKAFFEELGAEVITSNKTNRDIFNEGVKYCIDEACIPVKIFHGHTAILKNKCDKIFIPRIMQLNKREFICPKFCGLPEMIINNIPDLPPIITSPIYAYDYKNLLRFAKEAGREITSDNNKIKKALLYAINKEDTQNLVTNQKNYKLKIGLIGHPYNIYDSFLNMNIISKLNKLGVGVITEENIENKDIENEVRVLYKRPFWTFAKNSFGCSVHLAKSKKINGIIYVSSFACGIDSIVLELIKNTLEDFPILILKLDEHTGEAGVETRLEAYIDMLLRRENNENNSASLG